MVSFSGNYTTKDVVRTVNAKPFMAGWVRYPHFPPFLTIDVTHKQIPVSIQRHRNMEPLVLLY